MAERDMAEEGAGEKLTYGGYLRLEEILGAQRPRSGEHDEMLFIVIHQVYELWFKQMLHELRYLGGLLAAGQTTHSMRTLRRILSILKIVVAQLDVLETMTPVQFRKFRDALGTSSGFESVQFRELEATLGRRDFPAWAPRPQAADQPSIFDSYVTYLRAHDYPVPASEPAPASSSDNSKIREVLRRVYADDSGPAAVAELLVDLDEGLQEWRYRHVKMVERTIGYHSGTGGSTGAKYLASTLGKPLFPDLWSVRNLT